MPARFVQKYQIERDVPIKRNVVQNGDFTIWQRGTTFSGITGSVTRYVADRWALTVVNSGTWTVSRSNDVPSNNEAFSIEALVTGGDPVINPGDFVQLLHFIEGSNYKSLYQKFQVLSFWIKSNVVGTYHASLRNQGPMPNRSYVIPFTIDVANTWEKKELVVSNPISTGGSWNFTNGVGAYFTIALVCGTTFQTATPNQWVAGNFIATSSQINLGGAVNNFIRLAGVQLEEGQTPTPFQFVGIDEELARCQRYYETGADFFGDALSPPGLATGHEVYATSQFKATKRAIPTVTNVGFVAGGGGFVGTTFAGFGVIQLNGFMWATVHFAEDCGGTLSWTADAELI